MRQTTLTTAAVLAACVAAPALGAMLYPTPSLAQSASVAPTPAPALALRTLTPAQAQQDVALMRRALETIHPGLYRRTTKTRMDAAFADLERAVRRPMSELELYRRVSLLLAEIRCNHTKAEQAPAIEAWRRDNPGHLPFRFRLLEGRMIVESSDPNQPTLARGTEMLSINGRSVHALAETLGAYVPIDGDSVWARPTNLASDGDLMGSDFDHFYPYVYGFTPTYDLVVRDGVDRAPRTIRMAAMPFKAWRTLPWDGDRYRSNFSDTTTWRMLDTDTAYLRIVTFVNYRKPVDAPALYGKIFDEIKSAGAKRLILDLRDNGGGSGDATYPLTDFLTAKPFVWNKMIRFQSVRIGDLADAIDTWGDRNEAFFPPMEQFTPAPDGGFDLTPAASPDELLPRASAPNAFTGPVTILTSPVNGSGSTMLIAKLRDL
ncbi:MAG: S41 family peptidase, partial [Caulobacterales bacterium]